MIPLAKLWSWTGHAFILFAIGWAIFVRGGLSDKSLPEGVAISQGYWGLIVALIAANALIWTLALYVRAAKRENAKFLVPFNTNFEDLDDRNLIISWGSVTLFVIAVVIAIALFSVRYSDSILREWGKDAPMTGGFIGSRVQAHKVGCDHQPCFAVASQFDKNVRIPSGVNEYILYLTDGLLVVLVLTVAVGLVFLVISIVSHLEAKDDILT
jgi:hypothetical protein